MVKDKLISLCVARGYVDANWPNDPLLRQIAMNLLTTLPEVAGEEVQAVFDAVHLETKETCRIYAVEGTRFLIYVEAPGDSHWEWRDMKEFKPTES